MAMLLKLGTTLGVLHLFVALQMSHQSIDVDYDFNMAPNTFDDQYIGCTTEMEREMSKILDEELKYNNQLNVMWEEASRKWRRPSSIPPEFHDKYGIAVLLYTMQDPYPIYSQLNGNISIAGQSKDCYMKNFHFKALHFYVTRALQVLRKGCTHKTQVYRGMNIAYKDVAKEMRFDRFTSSSKDKEIAERFGTKPFFNISTWFGVDISKLSAFMEEEVLIPIGEKFNMINQAGTTYRLESTGQLCSYFNCAYLGGEKRNKPECTSGLQSLKKLWRPRSFLKRRIRKPFFADSFQTCWAPKAPFFRTRLYIGRPRHRGLLRGGKS